MKYRLLAMDMDGTFLNSQSMPIERNIQALKKAKEKGAVIAFASGRIYPAINEYVRMFGDDVAVIACNGALVYKSAKDGIIYRSYMPYEEVIKLLEIAREYKLYYHFFTEDRLFTVQLKYGSLLYKTWNDRLPPQERMMIEIIDDPYEVISQYKDNLVKFVVSDDDTDFLDNVVRKRIEESGNFEVTKSAKNNLEIMVKGVSKGRGLEILSKYLDIPKEQIIAVGDSLNDISMIRYAGLGVAMGNADERVIPWADYIAPTNDEGGIAHVVEKFMLS
ncbi:MAG: Cof-type HAD-IIB family hydrolase [Thermoanaerobacterium sp.]|nr:Cof-type HAD-IIB family hydrolase [Thermoanaerobacterium sp.]